MAITSSSTLEQIEADVIDNADYAEQSTASAGVTKAKAFLHAIRALMVRKPSEAQDGGQKSKFDFNALREMESSARAWLASNDSSRSDAGVAYVDVRNYRP